MPTALHLSRPAWAALAGVLAYAASRVARHLLDQRSRPSVPGPSGRISIDDGGTGGVPVLFVHSYAGTTAHWAAQLAHLRRNRRAVAINLRGHGGSAEPADDDYAAPALAQDIGAVADALGLKRFVLVGHSMGGLAAAAYAAQHPERLAGLMLVATPGRLAPDIAEQVLASLDTDYHRVMANYWQTLMQGARPSVRPMLEADMRRVPRRASKAMIRASFSYDASPALGSYRGPALLVDTAHDDGPGALHLLVPQMARERLTGTSHWPHLDDPERFNLALDDFLAQVRS